MKKNYRNRAESGKTHLILIGVLVLLLIVLAIRIATMPKPEETNTGGGAQASGGNKPAVDYIVPPAGRANERPRVPSQGELKLDVKLIDEFPGGVIDIGPSGEVLYSESVLNPPKLEVQFRKDKQNARSFPLEEGVKMGFSSNGELIKKEGMLLQAEKRVPTPSINLSFSDGSYLNLVSEKKNDKTVYRLQRVSAGKVAKVYFESELSSDLMQRPGDETFWIREHGEKRKSSLIRLDKGKQVRFDSPKDFDSAESVAESNGVAAATFGGASTRQPFRAFSLHEKDWTELPMPKEFVSSFVQCVTSDGLIFGLVSDAGSKVIKQIVWKDKAYTMLDSVPGWPSGKELPILDKLSPSGIVSIADQKAQEGWKSYLYSVHTVSH
jgi:hypothetical protein